jgi:hypothetical protein
VELNPQAPNSTAQPSIDLAGDPGEFVDILVTLRTLTRNHLVFYRMEVGRVLLDRFFAGAAAAYLDKNPNKAAKFSAFYVQHEQDLAELGLKEQVLRQCIQTYIVAQTLPDELVERLEFSKLVALTKVKDPTQRARLARAAVDEGWPVSKLRETIALAADGLFYDVNPDQPGVQTPTLGAAEVGKPKVGVVINRVERWAEQAVSWVDSLAQVEPSRLTSAQNKRLRQVLAEVRERLDGVEARVEQRG